MDLSAIKSVIQTMDEELNRAPEFKPSKYWQDINQKNIEMLATEGLSNFKRTLAQNYYNWLITSDHPQLQFLRDQCPLPDWLLNRLFTVEEGVRVQTILTAEAFDLKLEQRIVYARFVTLLWLLMEKYDKYGLALNVEEPLVGNPVQIMLQSQHRLISQDLANSIVECNTLLELHENASISRPRVAELGAGSGRLAHVHAATQGGLYAIFDITPALFVSQWYLSEIFPGKKIFRFRSFEDFEEIRAELEQADIAFFTSNQLAKIPKQYFNTVLSISTLPEMTKDQVRLFLSEFQRLSSDFVFLKQWDDLWENPLDGTSIRRDQYQLDETHWALHMDRTDPMNPQFFNRAWKRKK